MWVPCVAARENVVVKMYAQMTSKQPRTSTSSGDPLVASSPSGTLPQPSLPVGTDPTDSTARKKTAGKPQRMSQMLKDKLMMTNPLAWNMFNRGAVPEQAGEEEAGQIPAGPSSMELMPYAADYGGDPGGSYGNSPYQQQMMAESLRARYGVDIGADPTPGLNWQNSRNLFALPSLENDLATQESDINLQFGSARAGIGQYGLPGFAQAQNAAYQQKLMQQKKKQQHMLQTQSAGLTQSADAVSLDSRNSALDQNPLYDQKLMQQLPEQVQQTQISQFGSAGFAEGQSRLYQQKLLQQQQIKQQRQLQQQEMLQSLDVSEQQLQQNLTAPAAQDQFGSAGFAQRQNLMYQQKLQQQKARQQQLQQQRQLQASGYQSYDQSSGLSDDSSSLSYPQQQGISQHQSAPQQHQQQGSQYGSVGFTQGQNALYQQKLLQQQQKQQLLKQQVLDSGQADSEQLSPSSLVSPPYQQQLPASRQANDVAGDQQGLGQLGSAQHAQSQAAVYQQKLQQMKQKQQLQQQRQQQQLLQMTDPATLSQGLQLQQRQDMQDRQQQLATSTAAGQQLPTAFMTAAGSVISPAAAAPATPSESSQMGSVGFALAQNAKYQQQLQQQQLRRQQRQQLKQQQQLAPLVQQPRQQLQQQQQQPAPVAPQAAPGSEVRLL